MSEQGYSLSALETELDELRKDYVAFSKAYDILCQRVLESTELQPPRTPELHKWCGSRATIGSLEMAIHAIERTILEYDDLVQKVRAGELPNTDRPTLSIVKESDKP